MPFNISKQSSKSEAIPKITESIFGKKLLVVEGFCSLGFMSITVAHQQGFYCGVLIRTCSQTQT